MGKSYYHEVKVSKQISVTYFLVNTMKKKPTKNQDISSYNPRQQER